MIIVPIKEGENIEKALKKFKEGYLRTASQTERGVIPYSLSDSYIIPVESISGLPVFYAR